MKFSLGRLLRRNKRERSVESEQRNERPETRSMPHDPRLIARFEAHHKVAQGLYGKLRESAHDGEFERCEALLGKIDHVLGEHLGEEEHQLYDYLEWLYRDDPDTARLVKIMHKEMADIGRAMTGFINTYRTYGVGERNIKRFLEEMDAIADVFGDRIEREEATLYPLYKAPSAVG